ncbi:UDP-glycosyltransferase 92A1 [Citrus sinensis]|uniref:UDP-glycosyltransferase 92A1 n=1 Tax=Citrus sinensis TaxID=2711 RepID=A0ACB8ICA8_CITSI|nr:UDP-glycosyltransferase 92A1 [Citrus sinensis]
MDLNIIKSDVSAPACIVSHKFLGWTVEVANELGIFHSVFLAGAGYSFTIDFISLNNLQKCKADEDREFFILPDFPEVSTIESSQLRFDLKLNDATEALSLFCERQFSLCLCSDDVLLNNIDGLGDIGLTYFCRKMVGKPVWMIGPACSSVKKDSNTILPAQMKELALSTWLRTNVAGTQCWEVCIKGTNDRMAANGRVVLQLEDAAGSRCLYRDCKRKPGCNRHA